MWRKIASGMLLVLLPLALLACGTGSSRAGGSGLLTPVKGEIRLGLGEIDDGKAHHFRVKADDGTVVTFFVIKSQDGVFRAAVDACDVCYKEGKGYHQEGDFMVCENCGQKFASTRINEVKGGCNPAPLTRSVDDGQLVIPMAEINSNSWYMKYRK